MKLALRAGMAVIGGAGGVAAAECLGHIVDRLMEPPQPPLPTARNLPFQVAVGSQNSASDVGIGSGFERCGDPAKSGEVVNLAGVAGGREGAGFDGGCEVDRNGRGDLF